ncbi:hypothetical protein Y710_16460 [Gordonia sp. QH-12]|uniref:hypothetical protein n=1 Tax=Gordonia TaxID=2053 RepID=UPI00078427CD|nr:MULTISPECIES: hypothetical protein [Gordonia]KXT55937.1 hypothetical protein Y710_16460 [Gordonia sp. QH-12]WFN94158.1 hypothetical protein P5P27_06325 [Gordonia sihwensis]WFN94219.1 hypothetical protein P5P27_06635 [Gordonia sihwensis]
MRYKVSRSARRHRIGNAHIIAALQSETATVVEQRDNGAQLIIATDDRGVELEIGIRPSIEDPADLAIIFHCMPTHYRKEQS